MTLAAVASAADSPPAATTWKGASRCVPVCEPMWTRRTFTRSSMGAMSRLRRRATTKTLAHRDNNPVMAAAQLPRVAIGRPERVIGKSTVQAMRSFN